MPTRHRHRPTPPADPGLGEGCDSTAGTAGAQDQLIIDPRLRPGFTQVPNWLLEMGGISANARLLFSYLLMHCWQGDSCFPGQDRIVAAMGADKGTIKRWVEELTRAGLISVERRGRGMTNVYTLKARAPIAREHDDRRAEMPVTAPPGATAAKKQHQQNPDPMVGMMQNQESAKPRFTIRDGEDLDREDAGRENKACATDVTRRVSGLPPSAPPNDDDWVRLFVDGCVEGMGWKTAQKATREKIARLGRQYLADCAIGERCRFLGWMFSTSFIRENPQRLVAILETELCGWLDAGKPHCKKNGRIGGPAGPPNRTIGPDHTALEAWDVHETSEGDAASDDWAAIKRSLKSSLVGGSYHQHIAGTVLLNVRDDGTLVVGVRDDFERSWLERIVQRLAAEARAAVADGAIARMPPGFVFVVGTGIADRAA